MANILTNLIPDVYAALNVVSQEPVAFLDSITRDSTADRVALGQTMRASIAPANTSGEDVSPSMVIPAQADQTIGNKPFTIQKVRGFKFSWSGSDQRAADAGPGYLTVQQNQIAEAMRAARNEMEGFIAGQVYPLASAAYGTPGTALFSNTIGVASTAQAKKMLDDNGAPQMDRHMTLDTTSGAAIRSLFQLTKANEAGTLDTLRRGVLVDLNGFAIRETAQAPGSVVAGTGAGYLVNNGPGYVKGATTIAVDTGTGTILAGDIVSFAGDTSNRQYVVATALTGGNIVLQAPGLMAPVANNAAITVIATASRNLIYSRNAIVFGTRLPDLPKEGDLAIDRETITDPLNGVSYELAVYPGFRMVTYYLSIAYGVAVIKNEHLASLIY